MEIFNMILNEITSVINKVNNEELDIAIKAISKEKRIFVSGEGRSGLMAKGFAMRLMHLGYEVFVVGETITPALKEEDLFIAVSGSGKSNNVISDAKKAKSIGCKIITFTSNSKSELALSSDIVVIVPGTVKSDYGENRKSVQLLSSLFDQSIHIVLDAVCLCLSKRDNISNDTATSGHW